MEITGKVHCLFEQSGTFKNQFINMGIPAIDYDIQNVFGQTDCVIDIFLPKVSNTIEGAARSMISPDYARNFINDCILGNVTAVTQPTLFT